MLEKKKGHLLQKSRLVFVLYMGSKLDLSLDPCKFAGFIKGDRVGSIQYIIPGLQEKNREKTRGSDQETR